MQMWHDYARRFLQGTPQRYDIAAMQLICAAGLPGTDFMDIPLCLRTINRWAESVAYHTSKLYKHFKKKPGDYHYSEAYFRALCLITTLQRDFGVHYNPAKEPHDAVFDPPDSFLFGIIQGNGGTCGTLPVLYTAVGRRLGYPLRLVEAKGGLARHYFVRWDDPSNGERFNIEASGKGMTCPPDDYYRKGLYALTPVDEARGEFLQSQSPQRELSGFLSQRHYYLDRLGQHRKAATVMSWASALAPKNSFYRHFLLKSLDSWAAEIDRRKPKDFPEVLISAPIRRFTAMFPHELERYILGLEAVDNMLNDKGQDQKWWEPMRQGKPMLERPVKALVDFDSQSCHVHFRCGPGDWYKPEGRVPC
jgi:hypothetical protein